LLVSKKVEHHFKLNRLSFDRKAITILIKPAIASMVFPIGLALIIQGVTILISVFVGGSAVAIFNIYRTLSRVLVQGVTVINQAVWPEISYAYARYDKGVIVELIKRSGKVGLTVGVTFTGIIFPFSDYLINLWVGEVIFQDHVLLALMLFSTLLHVIWQKYWVFLMATNNHVAFAKYFICISIISFILTAFLLNLIGLYGSILALIFGEVLFWLFSRKYYYKVMENLC
jgi:O-antigen/teichoic acid export membrane protein